MIEAGLRDVIGVIISVAGATLLAFILYRRTTPSLPRWLRLTLGVLRWLAALIILLLVTDPVLRVTKTSQSEPVVAVLLDDSGSMAYPNREAKLDKVRDILSDSVIDRLSSKANVRFFTFSDVASEISSDEIEDLEPRGSRTDLAGGIESVLDGLDMKPSAFVLLSDGGLNFGEDALHFGSSLRIPVYAISLAGDQPTSDISIDRIETSGAAYANSVVPVWLHLTGSQPSDIETELTISDSAGTVLSKQVVVPGMGARTRVAVNIEAGEIGLHRFRAVLAPFEGEGVVANNSMAFSLKVIKGKIRVCLIAPHPSWDFAFARRSLEADANTDVSVMLTATGLRALHLEGAVTNLSRVITDLDVIAVFRGAKLGSAAEEVKQFVMDGGGLLVLSAGPSPQGLDEMNPFVVASSASREALLYTPRVTEAGGDHEIMNVEVGSHGPSWSGLPPVPIDGSVEGQRDQSTVLLSGLSGDRVVPMLAVMRYGLGRVVGFSAFDLWRWDLVPKGFGIESSVFTRLLLNSIGWLTEKGQTERLSLSTSKSTYLWGEPADIFARVTDENLRPESGASVEGEIRDADSGHTVRTFAMIDRGGGSHSARVDFLPPSRYVARATARKGLEVRGEARLEFSVDERGLEDFGVDGDRLILEQLAAATGGAVYPVRDSDRLADELNPGSVVMRRFEELRFNLTLWCFVVLVGILGVEWFVRRRKMLI